MITIAVVAASGLLLSVAGAAAGYTIAIRYPQSDNPHLMSEQTRRSLDDTRRHVENVYLTAVVNFLHVYAFWRTPISLGGYPPSRYTLKGVPVTIDVKELKHFLLNLDDKQGKHDKDFRACNEDPSFLKDLQEYRDLAVKPWVKERLLADRDMLIKKGLALALKQAEKNTFGWKAN